LFYGVLVIGLIANFFEKKTMEYLQKEGKSAKAIITAKEISKRQDGGFLYGIHYEFEFEGKVYSYKKWLIKNHVFFVDERTFLMNEIGDEIRINFVKDNPWTNFYFYNDYEESSDLRLSVLIMFVVLTFWLLLVKFVNRK
jgi:hypothetical protein